MNAELAPLTLRLATMADADQLLAWRNDAGTRAASHQGDPVAPDSHRRWLAAVLAQPGRQLWLAWRGDTAVGTVRADRGPAPQLGMVETTLSWTVSPDHRGGGIGRAIVVLAVQACAGPLHAEVRQGNTASVRIAQAVGLKFAGELNGTLHFRSHD